MDDRKPDEVASVLEEMHGAGKGVVGMKILGEGRINTPERKDASLRYVLGLGTVDAFIIGFQSADQVDDILKRTADAIAFSEELISGMGLASEKRRHGSRLAAPEQARFAARTIDLGHECVDHGSSPNAVSMSALHHARQMRRRILPGSSFRSLHAQVSWHREPIPLHVLDRGYDH